MIGPRNHIDTRTQEQKDADKAAFLAKLEAADQANRANRERLAAQFAERRAAFDARYSSSSSEK